MNNISNDTNSNPRLEALLKGEDVARILNISRAQAYILMQEGDLPTVRMGRTVRVRPADLGAFIDSRVA
jgi:excisionase family DNA binding protein